MMRQSLSNSLADQTATENVLFSANAPAGAFADVDTGEVLTYSATLDNGSALPAWLSFDAATRTFQGTPTMAATLSVRVTATDTGGLSASDVLGVIDSYNKR